MCRTVQTLTPPAGPAAQKPGFPIEKPGSGNTRAPAGVFFFDAPALPMDVGVLIPPDAPVRLLLVFILKRLDLNPLCGAYTAYRERRRREQADREREAAERGAGKLAVADEGEGKDTRTDRRAEKKKDGRPP